MTQINNRFLNLFSNIKYFAIMQKYIEINKFYNIYQIK